ncbi:MAG: ATP-binding region ATPase domain protein [Acidimicrobiaceae bacterium]|nr:ATP-binding region ATPase domain protein [Acidimicrobiaceae bacterium]
MTMTIEPRQEAPPKVLLVDDRPENLLALEGTLEGMPCQCVRANSGEEALRHLLVHDVALLLLDVQMPGLDGYQTARHIREREKTRHIPLIFISGIDRDVEPQLRGYASGAVDFLAKPFEPAALQSKVKIFLELDDRRRAVEKNQAELEARVAELAALRAELDQKSVDLSRANLALEGFASTASRALLEPAELASGFLSLLADETAREKGSAGRLLERARSATDKVVSTAEQLARFARSTGQAPISVPVPLDALMAEVLAEAEALIAARGARITLDPLPTVLGDPWYLRHVLAALLDNALRHGAERPRVHLGVSRRASSWVLTLHDDGPGIDPSALSGYFGQRGTPVGRHGAGLGLAFCHQAIKRLGGELWAVSSPGQGTDVSLSLPDAAPEAHDDAYRAAQSPEGSSKGSGPLETSIGQPRAGGRRRKADGAASAG